MDVCLCLCDVLMQSWIVILEKFTVIENTHEATWMGPLPLEENVVSAAQIQSD